MLRVRVSGTARCSVIRPMMRKDEQAGFETFFRTSRDPIFRAIWVSAGDRALAEDAVSEAFTRALERWSEVSLHPAPTAWVAQTAFNFVRTQRRSDRRLIELTPFDVSVSDESPIDPGLIRRVLALPRRQREVVALRVLLDLSTEHTAQLLGIASGTVTVHLFRALSRLEHEFAGSTEEEAGHE